MASEIKRISKDGFFVKCDGCDYRSGPLPLSVADTAAKMHVMLGGKHECVITDENHVEIIRILWDAK